MADEPQRPSHSVQRELAILPPDMDPDALRLDAPAYYRLHPFAGSEPEPQ